MKLQHIYQSDIDRDINGVIKVAQNDERSIEQELSEYIITRELRRHFNTFMNHYEKSLNIPTDKIGVWISPWGVCRMPRRAWLLASFLIRLKVTGDGIVNPFRAKRRTRARAKK